MIESAKVSNLLSKISDLSTASRNFKSRYGYPPGDLPNAAALITADGGISAGCSYAIDANVGNGIVDTVTESTCAPEHLVKAQMLSKTELVGSTYVIPHPFGGGSISLGVTATNDNAIRVTTLPCKIALQIDGKLDNSTATPLASGFVTGRDSSNAVVNTCTPGGANDPVDLLIRY